ncbi:TPA: TetR/AcrR family transcriptional regulator [Citrobacter koseri]|uniref:TetR/AcrR family transcriptional regulator n=1 Tax=Citrobacter koseri TaxID=545 RepID=UPI001A2D6120|nr:TetR/AcrR family transcriptional regulator [Citrobacter koseri]HDQ2604855.1 TetR/AcrR family transcriptional regulator [Citrobacter koseri]
MSRCLANDTRVKSPDRRKQVIDAAAKCFRKEGIHGCSIAKISKASGMSPGHIYYHFANKEAIVEALVKQQENSLLAMINDIKTSPMEDKLVDILIRHTAENVERHTSHEFIGLWLEIAAESARNPSVAELLKQSRASIVKQFNEQLILRHKIEDEKEILRLRAGMEIMSAIFVGLSVNTPQQNGENKINNALLTEVINDIAKHLFSHKC